MHIVIVGAGVIGMTSAYYLSQDGHDVTVVDSKPEPGEGASYANGGQLSYSFSDALGNPEFVRSLPQTLLGRDVGARAALSPGLMAWGLRLLAQSGRKTSTRNTLASYRSALRSKELLQTLRSETGIDFSFRAAGKLICLSGTKAIRRAEEAIRLKTPFGCDNVILSGQEAVEIEPALLGFRDVPEACIYSPGDEVGDARQFVVALRDWLKTNAGCQFLFDTDVDSITTERHEVVGLATRDDDIDCDAVVIAAGVQSASLVAPFGIRLPIRAMRGYSLSLPCTDKAPSVSVTVAERHFVLSRLGNMLRIAGFADFVDASDAGRIRARTDDLLRAARHVAPQAANFNAEEKHRWSGLRPMTPNSQPIIGQTPVRGLFINSGHGMLGWTLACSSGEALTTDVRQSLKA
jgi:D-amino-acid dehydrogenase